MKDKTTTLASLKKKVVDFRNERHWKEYNTIDNVLMSVVIELGELMEHFQWRDQTQSTDYLKNPEAYDEVRFELADVLVYLFTLADDLNIDISEAITDKLAKQAKKFPVKKVLAWKSMKPEERWRAYAKIKSEYRQKRKM